MTNILSKEINELKAELAKFKSKAMMRANEIQHLEGKIDMLKAGLDLAYSDGHQAGWTERGGGGD